jgi:hypothetical protein
VPVLGIGHVVCRDDYEPNDTIEQAVRLYDIDIDANFYFYRSYLGDEVFDEDWYYVDIPAMRKATIEINDKKVQTGSTESHFRIYHLNGMDSDVKQLEPFAIENNELVGRRKYFKIFADKKMFTPGTPTVDVGGDIVDYTVRLTGIVTLDSQ